MKKLKNLRRFPALARPRQFLSDLAYLSQRLETFERLFARVRALEWSQESQDLALANLASLRNTDSLSAGPAAAARESQQIAQILGDAASSVLAIEQSVSLDSTDEESPSDVIVMTLSSRSAESKRYTAGLHAFPGSIDALASQAKAIVIPFWLWSRLEAGSIKHIIRAAFELEVVVVKLDEDLGSKFWADGPNPNTERTSPIDKVLADLAACDAGIERLTLVAGKREPKSPDMIFIKLDRSRTPPF